MKSKENFTSLSKDLRKKCVNGIVHGIHTHRVGFPTHLKFEEKSFDPITKRMEKICFTNQWFQCKQITNHLINHETVLPTPPHFLKVLIFSVKLKILQSVVHLLRFLNSNLVYNSSTDQ